MANEAMSEERLREIESSWSRISSSATGLELIVRRAARKDIQELLFALREAQARAEKAEEDGYRRGVEAAIETAKQQRCRDEYPKTNREKISHERGCNGAIKRIRALLSSETQDETTGSVQEVTK